MDLAQWRPASNLVKHVQSVESLFDKEPQYQTVIQLDDPTVKATF